MGRAKLQLKAIESVGDTVDHDHSERVPASPRMDRKDTRVVTTYVPPATWSHLRKLAIDLNRTSQELMTEAIDDLFSKYSNH